jgi:hypothetical protein
MAGKPIWSGYWDGGRTREVDGRTVWVIERRIGGGVRKVITLDVHSEEDARAELALFSRDPLAYKTRSEQTAQKAADGVPRLDPDTIEDFYRYIGERVTPDHLKHTLKPYLEKWAEALGQRDLRTVRLREFQTHLNRWKTARHHRIVAIKSFTAYLREHDLLVRKEDPTLELKVPQAKPEKSTRPKGYTIQDVERYYAAIENQALRDTICLRAKAGMHDSEIARVARGAAFLRVVDDPCGIAGTIRFEHKTGNIHTVSLDAQAFAAAQRLQARKVPFSRNAARYALAKVHEELKQRYPKIPELQPGELRHSFATWAGEAGRLVHATGTGVPLADVAAVMGHHSPRTTKLFYNGAQVPPMIIVPIRLEHPKDPTSMKRGITSLASAR